MRGLMWGQMTYNSALPTPSLVLISFTFIDKPLKFLQGEFPNKYRGLSNTLQWKYPNDGLSRFGISKFELQIFEFSFLLLISSTFYKKKPQTPVRTLVAPSQQIQKFLESITTPALARQLYAPPIFSIIPVPIHLILLAIILRQRSLTRCSYPSFSIYLPSKKVVILVFFYYLITQV